MTPHAPSGPLLLTHLRSLTFLKWAVNVYALTEQVVALSEDSATIALTMHSFVWHAQSCCSHAWWRCSTAARPGGRCALAILASFSERSLQMRPCWCLRSGAEREAKRSLVAVWSAANAWGAGLVTDVPMNVQSRVANGGVPSQVMVSASFSC